MKEARICLAAWALLLLWAGRSAGGFFRQELGLGRSGPDGGRSWSGRTSFLMKAGEGPFVVGGVFEGREAAASRSPAGAERSWNRPWRKGTVGLERREGSGRFFRRAYAGSYEVGFFREGEPELAPDVRQAGHRDGALNGLALGLGFGPVSGNGFFSRQAVPGELLAVDLSGATLWLPAGETGRWGFLWVRSRWEIDAPGEDHPAGGESQVWGVRSSGRSGPLEWSALYSRSVGDGPDPFRERESGRRDLMSGSLAAGVFGGRLTVLAARSGPAYSNPLAGFGNAGFLRFSLRAERPFATGTVASAGFRYGEAGRMETRAAEWRVERLFREGFSIGLTQSVREEAGRGSSSPSRDLSVAAVLEHRPLPGWECLYELEAERRYGTRRTGPPVRRTAGIRVARGPFKVGYGGGTIWSAEFTSGRAGKARWRAGWRSGGRLDFRLDLPW